MKIKVNRNIFWTELFAGSLAAMGLKYVSISPGSRSTALTLSFVNNKKIKNFVHIDERSSAFFALGIAKATGIPAAVVCTSGTAAVEFYPAIVEAYQQSIPLIICTADRPPDQKGRGANQTINQENLYKNHIRLFIDAGLPGASVEGAKKICLIAEKAYKTALLESGPVHINFPFKKPFEPDAYTDEIYEDLLIPQVNAKNNDPVTSEKPGWFYELIDFIKQGKKILFIAGPGSSDPVFNNYCSALFEITGSPVFADVYSLLRFGRNSKINIITTYDIMLRLEELKLRIQPELIIQFGRTPTSKTLLDFLKVSPSRRILINSKGDWFDPSNKAEAAYAMEPSRFCKEAIEHLRNTVKNDNWISFFTEADKNINLVREKVLSQAAFNVEGKVISDILNAVPPNVNIMVSNSSPVRDMDYFAPLLKKNINLFYNRGASGIDGIVSTALGISAGLKKPVILITGDLAFFYDITALLAGMQYKLPVTIILLNNNGGGIFNNLPVARYKKIFRKYFITPHNLEFNSLVKSFGWNYKLIKSVPELKKRIDESISSGKPAVLEIKTDAEASLKLKNLYLQLAKKQFTND